MLRYRLAQTAFHPGYPQFSRLIARFIACPW
jgi:hypothetical protein